MTINEDLIKQLRLMAKQNSTIKMMIQAIRESTNSDDGLSLISSLYFRKAFFIGLREIRDIEGSACLGGKAYTDEEINEIMLPRIAKSRPLWERE